MLAPVTSSGIGTQSERDLFEREVLRLPLAHLCELPVTTSLVLHVNGIPMEVRCMTARRAEPEVGRGQDRAIVLDVDELRAVAIGVAAERLTSADFRGFCLLKLADPGFRIDDDIALAGAQASAAERANPWPLEKILAALDVRLAGASLLGGGPTLRPSRPPSPPERAGEPAAA